MLETALKTDVTLLLRNGWRLWTVQSSARQLRHLSPGPARLTPHGGVDRLEGLRVAAEPSDEGCQPCRNASSLDALSRPELFQEDAMLIKTSEGVTDKLHLGTNSFGGRLQPAPSRKKFMTPNLTPPCHFDTLKRSSRPHKQSSFYHCNPEKSRGALQQWLIGQTG